MCCFFRFKINENLFNAKLTNETLCNMNLSALQTAKTWDRARFLEENIYT